MGLRPFFVKESSVDYQLQKVWDLLGQDHDREKGQLNIANQIGYILLLSALLLYEIFCYLFIGKTKIMIFVNL